MMERLNPSQKKSVQFQPQDGANTVPGTSSQLKEMFHAILSLNPAAALRRLFLSQLLRQHWRKQNPEISSS